MLLQPRFSIILTAFLSLAFLNTVYASQNSSGDLQQNNLGRIYGKVTSIITTDSFTYVEVQTGKEKVWAAGPVTPVKKGDMVSFPSTMAMKNYHSKSLGHDFPVLYITNSFKVGKTKSATASLHVSTNEIRVGGYLRDVMMNGLSGKTKAISAFKGKPLLINIWASWCGPCRSEMGSLQRLAQRFNGKAFNIIGISTDDFRNKAAALIKQAGISFDNFIDHNRELENMLGAKTIPLTILVAADGRVLKKVHGARTWDSPDMIAAIGRVFQVKLMNKK